LRGGWSEQLRGYFNSKGEQQAFIKKKIRAPVKILRVAIKGQFVYYVRFSIFNRVPNRGNRKT